MSNSSVCGLHRQSLFVPCKISLLALGQWNQHLEDELTRRASFYSGMKLG
jgi:hypothetical protein